MRRPKNVRFFGFFSLFAWVFFYFKRPPLVDSAFAKGGFSAPGPAGRLEVHAVCSTEEAWAARADRAWIASSLRALRSKVLLKEWKVRRLDGRRAIHQPFLSHLVLGWRLSLSKKTRQRVDACRGEGLTPNFDKWSALFPTFCEVSLHKTQRLSPNFESIRSATLLGLFGSKPQAKSNRGSGCWFRCPGQTSRGSIQVPPCEVPSDGGCWPQDVCSDVFLV